MTYTQRMIEEQPAIASILAMSETHIYDMTGMEVKLLLEEPKRDEPADTLPLWGWQNTKHQNRYCYTPSRNDLVRILNLMAILWEVAPSYIQLPKRNREVVTMKQLFAMLVREKYPTLTLKDIARFMGRTDHSSAITWIQHGRMFLGMNDPYFMTYYSPVKFLFDADNL